MGYGKGKVGSVVLSRTKGQQVTRAYNDAPKNPRSTKQMLQRSIFASGVKFFAQGRQAFFKFAFENKALKESDYNAFMRENAKRGQYISKAAYNEGTYPVLSPFMMTKGSLPELDVELNSNGSAFTLALAGLTAESKWGDVSQKLIDTYGLMAGDIVTVCTIDGQGSTSTNTPDVMPDKRQRILWDIKQAIINVDSTETVAAVLGSTVGVAEDSLTVTPANMATDCIGAVITVSRNTAEGTKVSDAYLVLNTAANTAFENSKEEGFIGEVLSSWGATGEAILQGSLA